MGKAERIKELKRKKEQEIKEKKKQFRKNFLIYFLVVLISFLAALGASYLYQNITESKKNEIKKEDKMYSQAPDMQIDINKTYTAKFETSMGNFEAELFAKDTPKTVNNFVFLSRDGFYDGLTFHRIISDFMIQGGDPDGTGAGGPGYQFEDENLENAIYNRGSLAMANSGPDTNGSQFFIMVEDNQQMPKSYTVFGRIINGMDVVDQIAETEVSDNGQGEISRPVNPPKINKITIEEN